MPRFTCPTCQQHLSAPDSAVGQKVACPQCGQKILLPQAKPAANNRTVRIEPEPEQGLLLIPASVVSVVSRVPLALQPPEELPYAQSAEPVRVKVSARLLSWPAGCACCLAPAETTIAASAV